MFVGVVPILPIVKLNLCIIVPISQKKNDVDYPDSEHYFFIYASIFCLRSTNSNAPRSLPYKTTLLQTPDCPPARL